MLVYRIERDLKSMANISMHWRSRMRKVRDLRSNAYFCTIELIKKIELIEKPIVITITRVSPRSLDSDNLAYACKPIRDGIADAIWPDRPQRIRDDHEDVFWEYYQRRSKNKYLEISMCSDDIYNKLW